MSRKIEYFYFAHSAYAYLGAQALYDICATHDVTLVHKPFILSPVVEAQGSLPFRARTQAHVDYFFGREIERWAEYRAVDIVSFRPTYHDADYSLANGMIRVLGESGPAVDRMSLALLQAHWRDDADLSDIPTLSALATGLGHDAADLIARAGTHEVQALCEANSAEARQRDVFGSPTYIVAGDPFYGQDRLEMVERALIHPFRAPNWSNPPVD